MLKFGIVLSVLVAAALADVKCPTQGLYKTKSPAGCRQYIQCKDGKMTVENCSAFLKAFNPVKLECDYCWRVNCSAPATPWPAPTVRPTELPTKAPTPVTKAPAPVTKEPSPATKAPAPVTKEPSPVTKAPAPVTKEPSPVTKEPSPVTKAPAPVTKEHSPATKAPAPVPKDHSSVTKSFAPTEKTPSNNMNAKVYNEPTVFPTTTAAPGFWGKMKHFFGY